MSAPLTSVQFCDATGIKYRVLDYWCSLGVLRDTARGSGSSRTFTWDDVRFVRNLTLLRRYTSLSIAMEDADALTEGRVVVKDGFGVRLTITSEVVR